MRVLISRVILGAAVMATSAGFLVGTTAPAAAAGCRISYKHYSTVKVGRTGSKAGAVECLLGKAGYSIKVDRSFSTADAKKLAAFQGEHSLAATGKAKHATWAALISQGSTPALEHGDTGSSVRRLQLALRALGHTELPGTTLYGDLTEAAVESLQASVGLTVTGKVADPEWAVLQDGGQAPATDPVGTGGDGGTTTTTNGEVALEFAKEQLGEKYKYGAAGPDKWDCSGLTMKAWAAAGVSLPHNAAAQYKIGTKIKKADLQLGDLVFFYSGPSHVGIYAGNGEVIHAPEPGKKVSYIKIAYMPWKGARRPG